MGRQPRRGPGGSEPCELALRLVVADPAAHLGPPDAQNTPPFSGASTPESPAGRALRDKAPRSPKGLPCKTHTVLDWENGEFVGLDLGLLPTSTGGGLCLLKRRKFTTVSSWSTGTPQGLSIKATLTQPPS